MNQENWKIILAYLSDPENETQQQLLKEWLARDPLHQQELEQARWLWQETETMPESDEWKSSFQTIQNSIQSQAHQSEFNRSQPDQFPPGKRNISIWFSVAAAIVCVLFIFFYKSSVPSKTTVWLSKTAAPGKVLNVVLPDSTQIWLNSGSTISYPEDLKHAALRTVKLKGEAFFKVKRDTLHPFIVHSLNLQTRVLGTSFNIRAWAGHNAEVTVLTGKVAVSKDSAGKQSAAIHLVRNQKAVYQVKSSRLSRQDIEEATVAANWTTGQMEFEQLPLKEVFETIERRYDVQIITTDSYQNCKLTAHFNKVSLTEILETLKLTLGIQYTINKNIIHIKGGTCN